MELEVEVALLAKGLVRATCPSLPGCIVVAPRREQALEQIIRDVECYVASFHAVGSPKVVLAGEGPQRFKA